jgi:hypothetical protein
MKNQLFKYILLLFLMVSCSPSGNFIETYTFPEGNWDRFTNPLVHFQIENPGIYYDMFLELRFDPSSQPEDFLMTVIMTTPGGEVRSRDVKTNFSKAELNDNDAVFRILIRREYAFSEKGECTFEIENRASRMSTTGMNSLSIIIEESQDL